jgi:GAF domain-containing protein
MIQPLHERQAMLLEVTSDLIRASAPDELGRMTFERVSSAFGADICFNYRLDHPGHRLRLVFARGIPLEQLEAAQSLELGQAFCGTAAGGCEAVVADKQRIASDPKGGLVRELGATAYACYPLIHDPSVISMSWWSSKPVQLRLVAELDRRSCNKDGFEAIWRALSPTRGCTP